MNNVECPKCSGDGIERCSNPDHGLLDALSFRGADECRCPCCGWDKHHRIKLRSGEWEKCELCEGTGKTSKEKALQFEIEQA